MLNQCEIARILEIQSRPFAPAQVVNTSGSAPRNPGASMA
ncbi:XdhC family protein [Nocardia sp. NPDC004750]